MGVSGCYSVILLGKHLGGFQYFAVTNDAAINALVHMYFYIVGSISSR